MIELVKGRSKILLYQSAEELPAKRYSRYQKYLLIQSGIGSTIEDANKHLSKLFEFITNGLKEEAIGEAKNLFYNFYVIQEEIDPVSSAFVCMIHSIDGELIEDLSDDSVKRIIARISALGISREDVQDKVISLKKKLEKDLKQYCPTIHDNDNTYEFYAKLKRIILLAEEELSMEEDHPGITELEIQVLKESAPLNFDEDDPENVLMKQEVYFEDLCAVLEGNHVQNPAELSILQFYLRLEYYKRQADRLKNLRNQPAE